MSADEKDKIPLAQIKKLPYKTLNRMLKKMREHLKNDDVMKKIFDEYKVDISEIDYIPMMFDNLEVSASTNHGVITFNYKLLCDGDFTKDFSYGIHEITHWLQQTTGAKATRSSDDGDYLKNPHEQEAFSQQVAYIADNHGENEAETYVDDLLDHHDKSGKEADKLKDKLMEEV